MGLTSAAATESIMSMVSRDKAGIGSAMNDATRLDGTVGDLSAHGRERPATSVTNPAVNPSEAAR
jgi:hypothetical protein